MQSHILIWIIDKHLQSNLWCLNSIILILTCRLSRRIDHQLVWVNRLPCNKLNNQLNRKLRILLRIIGLLLGVWQIRLNSSQDSRILSVRIRVHRWVNRIQLRRLRRNPIHLKVLMNITMNSIIMIHLIFHGMTLCRLIVNHPEYLLLNNYNQLLRWMKINHWVRVSKCIIGIQH